MADYWKSQPRHFCEICKCWFGENKAYPKGCITCTLCKQATSIDFHESGKRHQENVKRHLRESRQKTAAKEKEKSETARALAAMERAALKAYQRDLEVQAGLPLSQDAVIPQQQWLGPVESQPQLQKQSTQKQYRSKQQQSKSTPTGPATVATPTPSSDVTAIPPPPPSQWQQLSAPEGVYYYNVLTGVSQWEPPAEFQAPQTTESTADSTEATPAAPTTISPTEGSSQAGQKWQQLSSPEGYVYYYNVSTGESQWEPPAEFQPPQQPQTTDGTTGSTEATPAAPTTASPAEGNSETGQKRTAEEARLEKRESYQPPKRAADSYGAWTTVAISYQDPEREETVGGDSDEDDDKESSSEDKKHKGIQFEEKTLPTVEQELTPGTFKGFNFKKRTGGSQKRPQIRQRTSEL